MIVVRNGDFFSNTIVNGVVVDKFKNLFDIVIDNIIGKRKKNRAFNLFQKDFSPELLEEVFILVEADGEKVEKISDVDVVSETAEVSCELCVEIHHVLEIRRIVTAVLLNVCIEPVNFFS